MKTSDRTMRGEPLVGAPVQSAPQAAIQVGGWSTSLENATLTNLTPITGTPLIAPAPARPSEVLRER
jgi:hypothetical protein